jgi:hypothetical protein
LFHNVASSKATITGKKVPLSLSAAVYSCIANEGFDIENIYTRLDEGLVQAQANGGNQVVSSGSVLEQRVFSVDRALQLIESGQTDELTEHAAPLLLSLLPLLEFADGVLQLDLESVNQNLRERLKEEPEFGCQ